MPAAAKADADLWSVSDKNAIAGPRKHTPREGVTYPLTSEGFTKMPAEDAVIFLRDPAFVVKNEEGQIVASMPSGAIAQTASEKGGVVLQSGDVIAKFAELTQPALLARVKAVPGGERFTRKDSRDKMIAFLTLDSDAARLRAGEPRNEGVAEDTLTGNMDRSAVDELLEGEAA